MPLAVLCPASLQQPDGYTLATENEASRLGTAVHDWLSDRLAKKDKDFDYYATKHTVKVKEVEKLSLKAFRLWCEVAELFPNPNVEVSHELTFKTLTLTGHMDVLSFNTAYKMVCVLDYKTGFLDGDHEEQIKTYGLLALDLFPQAEKVLAVILNVRDYTRDQQVYTRGALNSWLEERVVGRIIDDAGCYNSGPHCRFCNFRSHCIEYSAEIARSVDLINSGILVAPPAVYNSVLQIEKLCKLARLWLHDHVQDAGGSIPIDDKYVLKLSSTVEQEVIFGKALPVLRHHLNSDDIAGISSIGLGAMKDAIMANYGHGQKTKAVAGVMQELSEAGALQEKIKTQLVKRKRDDN